MMELTPQQPSELELELDIEQRTDREEFADW
jgi:hypothetical protein